MFSAGVSLLYEFMKEHLSLFHDSLDICRVKCLVLEVGIWKVFVVFQFSQPLLGLEELSL